IRAHHRVEPVHEPLRRALAPGRHDGRTRPRRRRAPGIARRIAAAVRAAPPRVRSRDLVRAVCRHARRRHRAGDLLFGGIGHSPWHLAVMLLSVGAVIGFVWANASFESYERFAGALRFVVNDVGMMFFFALAAKEVAEATAPDGDLSSMRRAAM